MSARAKPGAPDDQPEQDDPPIDEFVFNVVSSCLQSQLARIDTMDTKIGAIIAAIFAAIGFTLASDKTTLDYLLTLLFFAPLVVTVIAFRTQSWDIAPDPEYFFEKYDAYPQASKRTAIEAMVDSYKLNNLRIDRKSTLTNAGLYLSVLISIGFLLTRLSEAVVTRGN